MTLPFSRFIIVSSLVLFSISRSAFADTAGSLTFTKPQGVSGVMVFDTIDVFKGKKIRPCPPNPKKDPQHASLPPLTKDDNICYTCTDTDPVGSYGETYLDTSCTPTETDDCIRPFIHQHHQRTCTPKGCATNATIINDELFPDSSPGTAKYLSCPGTDACKPPNSFFVSKEEEKTYMYDADAPICIRGGLEEYASLGNAGAVLGAGGGASGGGTSSGWISDEELKKMVDEGRSMDGSKDDTLTYLADDRVYRGEWTNLDLKAKGVCSDVDSGCSPGSLAPVFYSPLRHLQRTFTHTPLFSDNTNNIGGGTCRSDTAKIKDISRLCSMYLFTDDIRNTLADAKIKPWYDALPADDHKFLEDLTTKLPPDDSEEFTATIRRLRALSLKSLSPYLHIDPSKHDFFYTLIPGSCQYTVEFTPEAIYPLIDKIKPTIEISAQIGSGTFTEEEKILLKQEETPVVGKPKVFNTGAYLAGSGVINITLVDSGTTTFTDPNLWTPYNASPGVNGISGIRTYTISICRTKTHTGMILNDDCAVSSEHSPTHQIFFSGTTFDEQYNATGEVIIPQTIIHTIALSDTENSDGIQVTGEYQIYIMMIDQAGNSNISSAIFNVVPEGFDPSRTRLDKYDDPVLETKAHTIYTISGTTAMIPGVGTGAAYANAIDIQKYKLSFFDIYGNPIYGWNLYDFGLTKTGVYLEQVARTGSSALFINSSGNTLSNTFHTRVTDGDGALRFTILSYTPGEFLEQYKFSYKNWDRHRNEIGGKKPYTFPENTTPPLSQTGSFFHIFTGALSLYTTNRIDLGTKNDIRMEFHTTSPTQNQTLTRFAVGNFLESIKSLSPDNFTITNTGRIISPTSHSYVPLISFISHYPNPAFLFGAVGTFIPEQKGGLFAASLKVEAYPYITLTFSGQTTRYYVSDRQAVFGSGIIYDTGSLNRIYVEGNKRSTGKEGYVDTLDSLGTINSADLRNRVRKNVALLLRNRDDTSKSKIIGRLKYIVGDNKLSELMTLSDRDDWDTLVIQGGNLIIDQDFNTGATLQSIAHKGIILLADEKSGSGGNIYITPNVTFIGGGLFAEESILSARPDGKPYEFSNSARALALSRQIVFYGGIYSKNTIGGAVRADSNGQYILPWKGKTDSLDEAVMYDLAFLRMDNKLKNSDLNKGRTEYVVVLTDTRNITDPLPGWK